MTDFSIRTPLMIPTNQNAVDTLVSNLKAELKDHFDFAPKSTKKLTEVALGTVGITGGQQQLNSLQKTAGLTEKHPNIDLISLLRYAEHDLTVDALLNHTDPMVRAVGESIMYASKNKCIITWSADDFYCRALSHCASLNDIEVKNSLQILKRNHSAEYGITLDCLDYAAEETINLRTFVVLDDNGNEIDRIVNSTYSWTSQKTKAAFHLNFETEMVEAMLEENDDGVEPNPDYSYITNDDGQRIHGKWEINEY